MKVFLFLTAFVLANCFPSWGQNFLVSSQGSSRGPFTVTSRKDCAYVQRQIKRDVSVPYKIFLDTRSVLSDTSIDVLIAQAKQTERLFGLSPGGLLREIHFVHETGSFFDHEFPSWIFISTNSRLAHDLDSVSESDISNIILVGKRGQVAHELSHLVNHHLGITERRSFTRFIKKIKNESLDSALFNLLYNDLSLSNCFAREMNVEIHEDLPVLNASELFSEVIATLDNPCWESVMEEYSHTHPDVLAYYKEALVITARSMKDVLRKFEIKTSTPVVLQLENRINQITKIQSGLK